MILELLDVEADPPLGLMDCRAALVASKQSIQSDRTESAGEGISVLEMPERTCHPKVRSHDA